MNSTPVNLAIKMHNFTNLHHKFMLNFIKCSTDVQYNLQFLTQLGQQLLSFSWTLNRQVNSSSNDNKGGLLVSWKNVNGGN